MLISKTVNNKHEKAIDEVISYFNTKESKWGYSLLLKGTKHFGYYPKGKESISMHEAQILMERQLGERLNLKPGSLVLDAGSGEGNVAINLARNFNYKIEGVDLLDFGVAAANEKAESLKMTKKVRFQRGDYTKTKFKAGTFDGVYTMETLVHVPDYKKALKEFRRILKPKGKLVLFEYTVLPPDQLTEYERNIWNIVIEESAMHSLPYFEHGKFEGILKEAGFKNIKVEDVTKQILPMLKRFYQLACLPYPLIKILGLQRKFVNATFAAEAYKVIKKDPWRYNVITAEKI